MADPHAETLRRLIALDAQLAGEGVLVSQFARDQGVSTKTVRRDLDLLASLGLPNEYAGRPEHVRRYEAGTTPLFARNVGRGKRGPRPRITITPAEARRLIEQHGNAEAAARAHGGVSGQWLRTLARA